jgi:phage repressor protein C with HTH and peptisase S24 domain
MNTIADRLTLRMTQLGLTQDQLAKDAKVSQTAIHKLCTGKAKQSRKIVQIAAALGVRADWLETGKGEMLDTGERISTQTAKWVDSLGEPIAEWNDEADLNPEEFAIIPRFDITVSAGNGHIVTEERQKNKGQAYRVDWLKAMGLKGHDLKSISAKGDSMLPTFGDGCTLLVDFSHKQISEGKVYVIRFGDEIRVKRIHKRPDGGVIIRSDNRDAYPDINVPPEEMKNIEILGRVRHYSGEL